MVQLKREARAIEKHPIPTTIGELRKHPLYVLARDIHVYQSLFPNDVKPIAHVKGEPVYNRSDVKLLCSKEKWLLEGRQVLENEKPYKTVAGRKKTGKKINGSRPAKQVELFGEWQTTLYQPPDIIDGIVPRNQYGNIEVSWIHIKSDHLKILIVFYSKVV